MTTQAHGPSPEATTCLILYGVSGCGKSTIAERIAKRTGATFIEGDDLHPESNKCKMNRAIPLEDTDRWPWFDAIAAAIKDILDSPPLPQLIVVTCSALKQSYRDHIDEAIAPSSVKWILLHGDRRLLEERLFTREHPFMSPRLLQSQLDTLEIPETAHVFNIADSPDEIVNQILDASGMST